MKSFSFFAIIIGLSITVNVSAQSTESGSTATGSGRTVEEMLSALLEKAQHLPDDVKKISVSAQKQSAWEAESKRLIERLAQHRRDCREALRKANRDTLMTKALQCYRSDLLQEINWLHEFEQYLSLVPYSSAPLLASATGAIANMIDAQSTIVDGIDAGVFETMESLEQAKRNLRQQYRLPYWNAVVKMRADRELTYLYFIAKKLSALGTPDHASASFVSLKEQTIRCLDTAHPQLLGVLTAADWKEASALLKIAQGTVEGCLDRFSALVRNVRQSEEEKTEESDA